MKVRALTSFAGTGVSVGMGDEFELPDGVDWLWAGLVEVIDEPEQEATVAEMPERAVKPKPRGRKRAT